MTRGRFLCGCPVHHSRQEVLDNSDTFDSMGVDAEGYLYCKYHGERQYGWRSDSYVTATRFDQAQARIDRDLPPLWWPFPGPVPVLLDVPVIEDRRDNRDPEDVGLMVISRVGEDLAATGGLSASDFYDIRTGQNMPPLPRLRALRPAPDAGRTLMQYQRRLAQSQVHRSA